MKAKFHVHEWWPGQQTKKDQLRVLACRGKAWIEATEQWAKLLYYSLYNLVNLGATHFFAYARVNEWGQVEVCKSCIR